jgi:hypothetical protein
MSQALTPSSTSGVGSDNNIKFALIAAILANVPQLYKQPCYTSPFTGYLWVRELLHPDTHPRRIRKSLGVRLHVFQRLLQVLRRIGCSDSKYITLEEKLAIFLHACVTGLTTPHLCERFQRSPDTICG